MGTSNDEINEKIKNGDYVKLNLHSKNTIIRGKDIFNTVMKKYQPVIDFYGEDSEVFQKLVNTNLLLDAEKLTSPDEKMFNYDSLKAWGDTEFIVEYEDGTKEKFPAIELLVITGERNCIKNNKKIINIFVSQKEANSAIEKYLSCDMCLTNSSAEISSLSVELRNSSDLENNVKNFEQLKYFCNVPVAIGKTASYFVNAFNITQYVQIFPCGEDTENTKQDYTINLIKSLYTNMVNIEGKLNYIESVIVNKAHKQTFLDIRAITNIINSMIQEMDNIVSIENKKATVMTFRNEINSFIQNYIDSSRVDYDNFIEWQAYYEKDQEFIPFNVSINIPHRRSYYDWDPPYSKPPRRIECILTKFKMTNPISMLPFSYEGLEYLKRLIVTRLNINFFIETDDCNLNIYNSNIVFSYLNNDSIHIAGLRKEINAAFQQLKMELDNFQSGITGSSEINKSAMTNLLYLTEFLANKYWIISSKPLADSGNMGNVDSFNHTPWFSSLPDLTYRFNSQPIPSYNDGGMPDYVYVKVIHDYPYSPSILFEASKSIELVKEVNDPAFLYDAAIVLEPLYKAKSNKLLEFAASLAALEIQLAMYLDDEDYEEYAK